MGQRCGAPPSVIANRATPESVWRGRTQSAGQRTAYTATNRSTQASGASQACPPPRHGRATTSQTMPKNGSRVTAGALVSKARPPASAESTRNGQRRPWSQ